VAAKSPKLKPSTRKKKRCEAASPTKGTKPVTVLQKLSSVKEKKHENTTAHNLSKQKE